MAIQTFYSLLLQKRIITITHQKKVARYFFTSSTTGVTEENSLRGTKHNLRCMTNTFGITEARLPDKLWPAPLSTTGQRVQDLARTEIAEENEAKIHCTAPKWVRGTWGRGGNQCGRHVWHCFDTAPCSFAWLESFHKPQISHAVCLQTLLQPLQLRHSCTNSECTCAFKNVHCKKLVYYN